MEQFRPENLSSTTKVQKNQRVVAMGATRLSIARRPLNLRLSFSVGVSDCGVSLVETSSTLSRQVISLQVL